MRHAEIASTETTLAGVLAQLEADRETTEAQIGRLGQRIEQLDAAIAAMTPLVAQRPACQMPSRPAGQAATSPAPRSRRVTADGLSREATLVVDALRKAGKPIKPSEALRAAGVPEHKRAVIRAELLQHRLLKAEGKTIAARWSLAQPSAPAKEVP